MRYPILLVLLVFLFFSSCSKDKVDLEDVCRINSVTNHHNGPTSGKSIFYTYDDKGRVTRIDYGSQPSPKYKTYSYHSNKIVVYDAQSNGIIEYALDGEGRIVKQGSYLTYTYNNEGYLIKFKNDFDERMSYDDITFTYDNGKIVKIDHFKVSGLGSTFQYVYTFEYDETVLNDQEFLVNPLNDISLIKVFIDGALSPFLGKASKQLVKKVTTSTTTTGFGLPPSTTTDTYTYLRDENGKLTTVTKKNTQGHIDENRITHLCSE